MDEIPPIDHTIQDTAAAPTPSRPRNQHINPPIRTFFRAPRENPTSTSYAQKQRKTQEPLRRKESWMKGVDAIEAIYYE
jgi:hypothetical protein